MIKIQGKFEEQIDSIVQSYMDRNGIKTKSEAVLKMVITFEKQGKEVLRLHNENLKLEKELEESKFAVNHIKESIRLLNDIA